MGCGSSNHCTCKCGVKIGTQSYTYLQVGLLTLRALSLEQSQRPALAEMLEVLEALVRVFVSVPVATAAPQRECIMCMERPVNTRLLPCRHSCLCIECAQILHRQGQRCPMDRAPIERIEEGTFATTFAP
jgi:hypothetical protein